MSTGTPKSAADHTTSRSETGVTDPVLVRSPFAAIIVSGDFPDEGVNINSLIYDIVDNGKLLLAENEDYCSDVVLLVNIDGTIVSLDCTFGNGKDANIAFSIDEFTQSMRTDLPPDRIIFEGMITFKSTEDRSSTQDRIDDQDGTAGVRRLYRRATELPDPSKPPDAEINRTKQQLKLRLPPSLIAEVENASKSASVSRNEWLESVIKNALKRSP